jgi:hypothetical protein
MPGALVRLKSRSDLPPDNWISGIGDAVVPWVPSPVVLAPFNLMSFFTLACPKNEEGRTGADAQTDANETDRQDRQTQTQQTDANTTDRRNQNSQTQTKVRQDDNVRSRRTSKDTDKTTSTELQRSQFAVVEDELTKHLTGDIS